MLMNDITELKIELCLGCKDLYASGYDKDGKKVYDTEDFNYRENEQKAEDGLAIKLKNDLGVTLPRHWGLALLGGHGLHYLDIGKYGKKIQLRTNIYGDWFLAPSEKPMLDGQHIDSE